MINQTSITSLINTLEKGGKRAQTGEIRLFGGKEYKKMGDGNWVPVVHKEQQQLDAMEAKKEVSPKQKLENKLSEKTDISHAQQSLENLRNGAIIEGVETRSGKPVFTNIEQALAHGCNANDMRELGNMHYDYAEKLSGTIERMVASGEKPEKALTDIATFHSKIGKMFIKQAAHIDDRNVKKSVVMMGHADAAEINTADFAIEHQSASNEGYWLDHMHNVMADYQYGDEPRVIHLNNGELYLVQVDDGMYSGTFKKITIVDDGQLIDNAKVRLERMTLPTLVQFCMAKGWLRPAEKPVNPVHVEELASKLEAPMMMVESELDKKIRILELLSKLTS